MRKLVWLGAIVTFVFVVMGFRQWLINSNAPPPLPANIHYSRKICDDAYKTGQNFAQENLDEVDVVLHDGCFSGTVTWPAAWNTWQCQLLGDKNDDWVSHWYGGSIEPKRPMTADQLNSDTNLGKLDNVSSHQARLQGKGTLRCYRVTPP
jgi:hypothetical protein